MPEPNDSPFAAYLRLSDARLRALPPERRAAIRRELLAHLSVELRFADGRTRQVATPALDMPWGRLTSIDRLTAPHLPVPGLTPATAQAPILLGDITPLSLPPAVEHLALAWNSSMQATNVRWSPDNQALLIRATANSAAGDDSARGFWLAPLDGTPPRQLVDSAIDAIWSPDGRTIIVLGPRDETSTGRGQYPISAYDRATGTRQALGATDHSEVAVLGTHMYFLNAGVLWRAALDGGSPERIAALPAAEPFFDSAALAVAPDGRRIAYRCASDLCLADATGRLLARLSLGFQPPQMLGADAPGAQDIPADAPYPWSFALVWSPDGQQLALATAATDQRGAPALRLLTRDGQLVRAVGLGPDGAVDAPQWLPDGRGLLLTTYPLDGRRIVAVMADSGAALDLTRPRWDAFASLSPDGAAVLLWNGRGGFWTAPLLVRL